MKKALGIMVAGLLLFGLAGQGMAAFSTLDLVRTIYDPSSASTTEIGSDLGANALTTAGAYTANTYVGDHLATSLFSDPAATLEVSYYALNGSTSAWVTGSTTDTAQKLLLHKNTNLSGLSTSLLGYYAGLSTISGTASSVLGSTAVGNNSYYQLAENNGTGVGTFASALSNISPSHTDATISLAALTTNGYVDSTLWYFLYNNNTGTVGTEVVTIRTFLTDSATSTNIDKNGTYIATEIDPQAPTVPIPPSLLLLAPGLLGLIGVRSRRA
ncbi:MAG: hypothetical protein ABSH25_00495 [Syntrophorhabdales bacterium]|jgi:hypothetical protein